MKIVQELRDPDFKEGDLIISNRIAFQTETAKMLLPNGFQCWIKISNTTKDRVDYFMQYSEGTGGNFAGAKMNTLELFRHQAITGNVTPTEFYNMVSKTCPEYDCRYILDYTSVTEISKFRHTEIRDKVGITAFMGGLRAPFTTSDEETGEVCVTFSGASAEQDLLLATLIFGGVQLALSQCDKKRWYQFDLTKLEAIPIMDYYFKIFDILAVMRK